MGCAQSSFVTSSLVSHALQSVTVRVAQNVEIMEKLPPPTGWGRFPFGLYTCKAMLTLTFYVPKKETGSTRGA